jgi:hypothetical protein
MSPHRAFRRVHVCMKAPCTYCAARANAQYPPDGVGGYTEMLSAVAHELRRRMVETPDRPKPRKKRR